MSVRKYLSEFSLHMVGGFHLLAQQDDLEREEIVEALQEFPCHIYMVCRRPRITLDPSVFSVVGDTLHLRFQIQRGTDRASYDISLRNLLGYQDLKLECPFPHSRFAVLNSEGSRLSEGKVGYLAHKSPAMWEHLDLEVLYIGQAYGTAGSRTAAQRLQSHSTLQGIYATAMTNSPDQEIWLLLWHFEEMLIATFDGATKQYGTTDSEDDAHIQEVLGTEVTEAQRINFTEAALIRYFQPEYNKVYKSSFPNPAHETYSECYDLDYNSVSVEIVTEDLGCRLWSAMCAPSWWHFPTFALHSREERVAMFDFAEIRASSE